jgi:phage/plasmid primase-like uncharacterized protein
MFKKEISMAYYDVEKVRAQAVGNWLFIVAALAPHAQEALNKPGRHVSCPIHGGEDGFRVFKKNFLETGGGVCNSCGARSDGFKLLMWLNDWSFKVALDTIGEFLDVEPELTFKQKFALARQGKYDLSQEGKKSDNPATLPEKSEIAAQPAPVALEVQSKPGTEEPEPANPLLKAQSTPWLVEVQERLERDSARRRADGVKLSEKVSRVWERCLPLGSDAVSPMRSYLINRKLIFRRRVIMESNSLRFDPAMPYYDEDGKEVGKHPAIVCAIRNSKGDLITLHRIYLTPTGKKAKVPSPKKMMPVPDGLTVTGAAIQLGQPHEGVLGVAEGVETALSAYCASYFPVWATVSATLMESFVPPEGVHTVIIWADKDRSLTGEKSANVLKERLENVGIKVIVCFPPVPIPSRAKGVDWNDVLMTQGKLAFPNPIRLRNVIFKQCEKKAL